MKTITLRQLKSFIDKLTDLDSFYQQIIDYLQPYDYTDHTINEAQRYADYKYNLLKEKYSQ